MARVAVAYVEIRPDLTGFAELLKAELAKVHQTYKVKVEADARGFARDLRTKLAAVSVGQKAKVEPDTTGFVRELRRRLEAYQQVVYRVAVRPDIRGFNVALRTELAALTRYGVRVPVVPDTRGFVAELRARLAGMRPLRVPVTPDVAGFRAALREAVSDNGVVRVASQAGRRAGTAMGQQMGTSAAGRMLNTLARSLGRYNFAMFFAGSMLRALGTLTDGLARMGRAALGALTSTFESAFRVVFTYSKEIGVLLVSVGRRATAATAGVVASGVETSAATAAIGAEATAATGGVAALAAALALLAAGMTAVTVAAGALQVVLGAVLAVAIPLVGAISALVASFAQLAGIGVGAVGLIPTALGAALAAFGPLVLVADRFEKLMEDTAEHTGELFVVVERLKNAIFAIVSAGFVEAIEGFVDDTLPKLVGGIAAVSAAWNRFLLAMVELASAPAVVASLNTLLGMGAQLVDFLTANVKVLAPALLTLATAGGGAFTRMLDAVTALVAVFGDWVAQMAESGQLTTFFDAIASLLVRILGLVVALAPLMSNWMTAVLPPAQQFLDILGRILGYWDGLSASAAGQQVIRTFFESMNRILAQLAPMLTVVVDEFMRFGPTLASLVEGARPAFEALVGVLFQLMRDVAPGLLHFLEEFAANLSDPTVQNMLTGLAESVSALLATMGEKTNMVFFIGAMTALIDIVNGLAAAAQALLIVWVHVFNSLITVLNWVIDAINEWTTSLNQKLGFLGVNIGKISNVVEIDVRKIMVATTNASKTAIASFGSMGASLTSFANADAWQAIIDNAGAAAQALNNMGQTAYAAGNAQDAAQFEKLVGRAFMANRAARKVAPPNTSGVANAWASAFGGAVGTAMSSAGATAAKTAGKKTAAGFITTLTAAVKNLDPMALIAHSAAWTKVGRNIANYIASGITSGSANINKVGAYIAKKFPSYIKKIQTYITQYKAAATPFVKELGRRLNVDQLNTLLDQIKDFKAKAFEALTPHRDLVNVFGFIPTPAETRNQLQLQLDNMRAFTAGIEALQRKGLSKDLAAAWLQAGAETAGNLVQGLADATPEQLAEINRLYGQIGTEAAATADRQATGFYKVGQSTVEGLIKGIASQQAAAVKAIDTLLDQALAAAKKKLGIKSPSSVFGDMGIQSVLGYIGGIESKTNATVAAVDDLYRTVTAVPPADLAPPTVRPGYASAGALAGMTAPPPVVNVRVYLGDREITDILRTQVEGYDTTRARVLLAGRRGG